MNPASIGPAVALIQSERLEAERKGGKSWDAPGIRAVLAAADGPIEDVMRAQEDLVEVVHTLRQVVCIKG